MSGPRAGALYTTELLGLAVEVANYPFDPHAPFQGEARSRSCGSTLALSFARDDDGGLHGIGLRLSACAVGQAAAAIFASSAEGRTAEQLATAQDQLADWLAGAGPLPDWPRIAMLSAALDHPGRHEAIQLPWRAALAALSKAKAAG